MTDTVSRPQLLTGDQKVFMQLSEGKVTVRVGGAYIPLSQWTKELTAVGEKGTKKWKMSFFFGHVLASSNKLIHVFWVSILVFSLPTTHPFMDHILVSTQPSHPTQLNITQIQAMTILSVLWMHNRPLQLCAETFWTRDVGGLMLLD